MQKRSYIGTMTATTNKKWLESHDHWHRLKDSFRFQGFWIAIVLVALIALFFQM